MFFRRARPRVPTFEQRVEGLGQAGFTVVPEGSGQVRVSRGDCAAVVEKGDQGEARLERCGVLVDGELAATVDSGNQKFLETPSRRQLPALASHLKTLHTFAEDLRAQLGIESLYNESLGTVNQSHRYDRLKGRE